MENGGASTEGVLIPVPETSEEFQSCILAPLQSAYLYEESRQFFRYKSAVLVKNPELEEKYNAFQAKRRLAGYSDHDLKESYGFLLFDDNDKANALGETGVFTGNSACTTLGDPLKGVYISMYSDCLDQNPWYHGKSGYIAIIRLTKGKVKKVVENYTQNFTEPSVGFDCHVSEQLPSVSNKTSSFLAFERTQYYIYELLDDGSNGTALSPSAACPFAIVSFSYMDTKATPVTQEKSERKTLVYQYLPWTGQFQINNQFYHVGLRSTAVAFIPAKLPPVIKVDRGISMSALRQVLPRSVFENCYAEEVYQDGFYCSLGEFVPVEGTEGSSSFTQLLSEIKENDFAFTVPLNDSGFLLLLHSSHFLRYDDTESTSAEALQGLFVFPDSRAVKRDTKFGWNKFAAPKEILSLLPVMSYAEGEVEKTPMDPSNDLCEVLAQHIQSYATLINPGLSSPSRPQRELSIFPDQYDVPIDHKHLYSSSEWTNRTWESFKSYLSKPASFQLPVSKVSEILAAGQEEQREDLDDDVYICLSSPEELPVGPVDMDIEHSLSDHESPSNEASVDTSNAELQVSPVSVTESIVRDNLQAGDDAKDQNCNNLTELNNTDDTKVKRLLTPTSEDLPAELIVSITSAEQRVTDETLSSAGALSTTKHGDFHFSEFSQIAKLQAADINAVGNQTDKTRKLLHPSVVTKLRRRKRGKLRRKPSQAQKKASKPGIETRSLPTVISALEVDSLNCNTNEQPKELDFPQPNNSLKTRWKKLQRRKCRFGKPSSKNKVRSGPIGSAKAEGNNLDDGQRSLESSILMELEAFHLRKKTERWDLKPVVSECRRILVPFGSVDIADQVRSLKVKLQATKNDECLEKMSPDFPVTRPDSDEMEKETSIVSQTEVTETVAADSTSCVDNIPSATNVASEQSIVEQPVDDNNSVLSTTDLNISSSQNNNTDNLLVHVIQSKQTDTLSPVKHLSKGEYLLSQLKSVLSRQKRKLDLLRSDEKVENTCQEDQPCLKKANVDSDAEMLKCNNATTPAADSSVSPVSEMPSVDPAFARYLGLTPKESLNKVQKTVGQQQKYSVENEKPVSLEKHLQIVQKPLSIFPRRKRIKTLKMHQGISAEIVKKKWWLHFQTPACYTTEKVTENDCSSDNTVRKTVEEKMKSACSSTDALNLLADLALSVSYDQVPLQPNEALDKNPNESLKKCDPKKGLSSSEQESILHALLKTPPAAKFIQPVTSPSQSSPLGDDELIALVSKEHDYSLPPSSCLLLDLPGTTFQVLPVSGSTRLLNHHQSMYGSGDNTLHPSVIQYDSSEYLRTSEYSQRHKQKFRYSRTSVIKDGSIKVTRKCQENYNFNLDSQFTSDPKSRVVIRALHGPWDFSTPKTTEEMQLIYHMWIGLFYSRSTARFFQIDPSFVHQSLDERDPVKKATEMVSGPARFEHNTSSSVALSSVTNTPDLMVSEVLDLSTKDSTLLESESEVLDLSQRNSVVETVSSEPQVNRKESSEEMEPPETLNGSKLPVEVQEEEAFKSCKKMEMETISEVNVDNINKNKKTEFIPKALCPDFTEVPASKVERTNFSQHEEMKNISFEPETDQVAVGIDQELPGSNKDTTCTKYHTENSEITEKSLEQKDETDSLEFDMDKKVNSNSEENELVQMDKHGKLEESCKISTYPCPEGNEDLFYDMTHTDDGSANRESDIICKEDKVVNGNVSSEVESKDVSPDQNDSLNRNVDCNGLTELKDDYLREAATEMDQDLRDQPLPKKCDGPINVCISECDHQAQKHKQLPLAASTKDICYTNPIQLKGPILNSCCTQAGITSISEKDPSAEENFETNKENCLKPLLPYSDESTSSPEESFIPKVNGSFETADKTKEANFNVHPNHEQEIKPTEKEDDIGEKTPQEAFQLQAPSKCEVVNMGKPDESSPENMDSEINKTNGKLDKSWDGITIPFLETSTDEIHVVQLQDEAGKAVQSQEVIPFIHETSGPLDELPIDQFSPSEICAENAKLSTHEMPLLDASKINKLDVLARVLDRRSPTPTMDEKPFEYGSSSSPSSSAFAYSGSEICQNITEKCSSRSSTPVMEELPLHQKHQTSAANVERNHLHGLGPDIEFRTLRVLQGIDKYISTAYHFGMHTQTEMADQKSSPNSSNLSSKKSTPTSLDPGHISVDFTNRRTREKPPEVSSTQDLHPKSIRSVPASPFKNKLKERLNVKLKPKNKYSSIQSHQFKRSNRQKHSIESDLQSSGSCATAVDLQDKPTSQSYFIPGSCSQSQHPALVVKPSKSEEIQAHWLSKDDVEATPKNKQPVTQIVQNFFTNLMLSKNTLKGNFDHLNNHETVELSSKTSLLANTNYNSYKTEVKPALNPPRQYKKTNTSEFTVSSLPSIQSFDSTESYPENDQCQGFFEYSLDETVEHTAKQRICKGYSDKLSIYDKDDDLSKEVHIPELLCTVFNTGQDKSYSILDQLSQRCLSDDLTKASVEQESLIFSEKMKNLLKKSKGGSFSQQDTCDGLTQSFHSPLTVNFSNLEEQHDDLELLDMPLVTQKIRVDMSDRKGLTDSTKEGKMFCPPSQTDSPVEHAGISGLIAEYSKVYEAKMHNVCSIRKTSCRPKRFQQDYSGALSNNFDFCDQMKKELDKSFQSNLNAVVKKSCKTKYRFYILVTSDDAFFDETKTLLETEGHTAVQPSEFFRGDGSSSCLLIIVRNEDIAEHICKIPHLLELKMTPGVQFAGIDEPDDVVNLTHQELFTRAGFIMLDKAVLEPLSLCNMKKISETLQELSRMGKWKWMLHYKDSRRLKENARVSEEANEKKLFLYCGQDAGVLEVLPYHECDSMSKDQPDYLTCLLRLQIQQISSRYPVFITDAKTDSAFGKKGILTMTLDTFLTKSPMEIFTV
ncbi:uncharacterized protein tasor2 [Austrofundulus limnaeus]|uniref:Uncharacterized protein tasor2 n=1 Tax=Austrofundulus limnaeus TaxID=52670 RepID=A0A2I4BXV1_AUSLI|nr:PREDICTED: uncharacterized protein LOC106523639 [Austrofundulus limnaeus]